MQSEKNFNKAIGKLIQNKRKLKGPTQDGLADVLGLSRTSITNIENGTQKLSVYNLYLIACYLDVHPEEILLSFNSFREQFDQRETPKFDRPSEKLLHSISINRNRSATS